MTSADVSQLAAKVYLNDASQELWTDSILIPVVAKAVLGLEQLLRLNEIPFQRETSATIDIDTDDAFLPSMPTDFIEPIWLKERLRDSTDDWVDVGEVEEIDVNLDDSDRVIHWAFEGGVIKINIPTTQREVLMKYRATLTPVTATSSVIDLVQSKDYLAAKVAELVARNMGHNPSKADEIRDNYAQPAEEILIQTLTKNTQGISYRRMPYRGKNRAWSR